MAIKNISQISCSLNLGLIFDFKYSYNPQNGVSISIYFVNQTGDYQDPTLLPLHKANVMIGPASFSVYPIRSRIEYSDRRRVMMVEFVDETFLLDHYYVALPNRGCGLNVFTLGTPVDNRTPEQKVAAAIDPVAQQIKELTQYPDYEYTFTQFLAILGAKMNVQLLAAINQVNPVTGLPITRDYVGSFKEVLNAWCQNYNLSFFFENGTIKIFDPTQLVVTFPDQPVDAIEYSREQDITDTYGKTVCDWYQQDGNQYPLGQTNDSSGPLYLRYNTLFPVGHEFDLPQTTIDLNQVGAAMYGQHFWFLYNFWKGTTSTECGWTPINSSTINSSTIPGILSSAMAIGGGIAVFDENLFNQKFEMYQKYGQEIAGRWYLSTEESDLAIEENFQWFDETAGQIFSFQDVDNKAIKLEFETPVVDGLNIIQSTIINQYFPGINYVGNRVAYHDDYKVDWATAFALPGSNAAAQTALANLIEITFQGLFDVKGSDSMKFDELYLQFNQAKFLVYTLTNNIPQDIIALINGLQDKQVYFKPRFTSVPIVGVSKSDYSSLKAAQNEPNNVQIINGTQGPDVVTNTSVIKTLQQGNYTIYYDKYAICRSASTSDVYFGYKFEPYQVSLDNQIDVTFTKQAGNSYVLNRNYGIINALVNNPFLPALAQARAFPTITVSFSLNYFYNVPANFLTNGLVGMSISVGDNGITSSYTFSNSVLQPPNFSIQFKNYEQQIKNSFIRTYRPTEVIT